MISIIFIILSVLWIILAGWIISESAKMSSSGDDGSIGILALFIIICVPALNAMAYLIHTRDLVIIKNQTEIIGIKEEAIARINSDLAELPTQTALMNADSPAAALIEAKSSYIAELTKAKEDVLDSKMNIERRKIGPSAWTVWIAGERLK